MTTVFPEEDNQPRWTATSRPVRGAAEYTTAMDEERESYESGTARPLVSEEDAREFLGLDEMPRMHTATYERLGNKVSFRDLTKTVAPPTPDTLPGDPAAK